MVVDGKIPVAHRPRISVFPKCFFDELCRGEMDYLEWLAEVGTLGAEGVEHYDGFFARLAEVEFDGWISVEDGMNGLDELRRSVQFLQEMREKYFPSTAAN